MVSLMNENVKTTDEDECMGDPDYAIERAEDGEAPKRCTDETDARDPE